jgi:hypothetical protein
MLHLELRLHAELRSFLDHERFVLESLDSSGGLQVNGDVRASLYLQGEGQDDAFTRVVGVGEVLSGAKAQRLFPLAEGLVILVCR